MRWPAGSDRQPGPRPVVYLLRDYPSLSQTFVRNEIRSLRDRGLDVEVVALRDTDPTNIPAGWGGPYRVAWRQERVRGLLDGLWWLAHHPVRFGRMWRQVQACGQRERWTALYLVPTLARRLGPRRYRACHTHFAFENAYPARYLAALLGCPASITVHAADLYRDVDAAVRLLRHFATVVTVCRFNVDLLVAHGLPAGVVRVVACGVDLPPVTDPASLTDLPGVGDPPTATAGPTLVSVGRLVPKKGFDVLVRALPELLAAVPTARLQIIGSGPQERELRDLVTALGVGPAVELLGARPHTEALAAIARADVFVLACLVPADGDSDALPVVLREAMARGRRVVTTAVAGIPETIDDASGWVVAPSDPAALAAALVRAVTDPAAPERGRRARERVAAEYTLDRSAADLATIFDHAADRRPRGRRRPARAPRTVHAVGTAGRP